MEGGDEERGSLEEEGVHWTAWGSCHARRRHGDLGPQAVVAGERDVQEPSFQKLQDLKSSEVRSLGESRRSDGV